MTEICQLFDPNNDFNADSVLQETLLNDPEYNPEWLLSDNQLFESSVGGVLSENPFSTDIDIKMDVKVEVDDLKDFSDVSLKDLADSGSQDEDFMMPPIDIKQSDSPDNDGDDEEDDGNSSSSDSSSVRHAIRTTGLVTPPEEESYGHSALRGVSSSSSVTNVSRPALAVRPVARHATLSSSGSGVTTVDAATTGGSRSSGIRYVVQRQGNPTVYLQANANGRLRQVVPRLKRQETKPSDLACTDHYYDNAGSSEDVNGYMVYPPSPPGSSSPDNDHSMVSAAAAAGIYPGHHAYSYSSHLHRSNSNHPPPMFQSPIPQSGVLILTEEEKRTLIAEGYSIPTRLPLTKQEERNLKKIRRKIKNKISAQESRRKKKEYVETLEKKVEAYSHENTELKRRVETLENNNRSLINQLRQLQHLVGKAGSSTASTCLMVFVLFFAAFLAGPALPSSDLHQMGYAASLPRLPGPPLMPPPRVDLPRVSAQESRGLARFYSDDKLTARMRHVLNSARSDVDSPRLLGDSQPPRSQNRRVDCSFASRIWCLFGAPCCTPDEGMFEEDIEIDGSNVVVLGNATNSVEGKAMFSVVIQNGRQYINATTVW